MQVPLQIAFRGFEPDPGLAEEIGRRAGKLEQFWDRITSCTVTVESPHHHQRQGNLYQVRIHLAVPGHQDILVTHERDVHHAYEDLRVAIRDAFKSARRQVQDAVRVMQGAVKTHAAPEHGRVARILPEKEFGFLMTDDGREIYFHAHSLVDAELEDLQVGTELRYVEEQGDAGPQATSVQLVGRRHHLA